MLQFTEKLLHYRRGSYYSWCQLEIISFSDIIGVKVDLRISNEMRLRSTEKEI